jgi:hypothetical protein
VFILLTNLIFLPFSGEISTQVIKGYFLIRLPMYVCYLLKINSFRRKLIYTFNERVKKVRFRVARWYIFKPKIPLWVNFRGSWNGKGWYILWPFGIYILRPFGTVYGHFVI